MAELKIRGVPPVGDVVDAVYLAARTLDIWDVWALDGRYHFMLGGGWSLAVSADSADRIRVETCLRTHPRSSMWALAQRHDRLAGVIERMSTVPEIA